jgi:hypothetical protein
MLTAMSTARQMHRGIVDRDDGAGNPRQIDRADRPAAGDDADDLDGAAARKPLGAASGHETPDG